MKKLSFFLWASIALIFLNFSNQSIAQPPPNLTLSEQMDYLMAPLDFTEVTSGLLLDKGFPMMEIAAYDGTTNGDTIKEYGDWFRQFGTMVTSKTGTTSPIGVTADYKPIADSLLKSGVIPIMLMHAEYHKFISDSTALSALITFQNNQLNDVAGRTSSPYELHEIVTFSPKKNKYYDKLSHDFRINVDFIRSNVSKTISSIQIDFDNGSGYQTMTLGSNSKVTWGSFGKKVLKLKITYTDSSVYHAKAQISLIDKSGGQPKYNSPRDETVYIPHPTIADHGVELAIAYGCGNNNELRKPFIYVEGFNPELFGDQFYEDDFFDDFDFYETEQWPQGFPLLSELDENGYDVVYVDFDRGDGSLIENAKALQAAINWINEEKAANCSSSDNILVGYSMGGVVARLALTYMEDDAEDHEVSYYVSVDSPHRGANIPRGIIAALIDIRNYHFAGFDVSEDVPQVEQAYQVLFSPAAKQMLLYSGEGSNTLITGHGPTYTSFQNHLHNEQGMPTQTLQNIAIAKGGGTGAGQFGSMDPILDINTSTFNASSCFNVPLFVGGGLSGITTNYTPNVEGWFAGAFALLKLGLYAKVVVDINAMPGYDSNELEIYERKIRLVANIPIINIPYFYWDSHNTYAQNVNFYDGVQGGTYDISSFSTDDPALTALIDDVVDGEYEPCVELHERTFAFIPTASALDLENFMGHPNAIPNSIIDPLALVTNGETPFQKAFILDPTQYPTGFVAPTNESHLVLTPSNVFPFSTIVPPAFTTNSIGTIAGFSYNHGFAGESDGFVHTSDRITRLINVGVSQTGSLCINCNGVLDISTLTTNPQNEAEHFAVELTQNCGSGFGRLNIGANGTLKIGENSGKTGMLTVRSNSWIELNGGFIEIREGSKLIIDSGAELRLNSGQLKVYDGGQVIIKPGGLLRYENGTTIELNGDDSQLALGGLTHIGNDATFTFTYQGTESGYIRLLEEGHWGQRFSAGTNAKIKLDGEGPDDLILYMEYDVDFWEYVGTVPGQPFTSNDFVDIQFRDGKITMEGKARIVLKKKAKFYNTHVHSLYTNGHYARGIETFDRLEISTSLFDRITTKAPLQYLGTGFLIASNSIFQSYSNFQITGGWYRMRYCDFLNSNVESFDCTSSTLVYGCTFSGTNSSLSDLSLATSSIANSSFENCTTALYKEFGTMVVRCSRFTDCGTAIFGSKESELNLSSTFNAGYNYFNDNDYNIYLWQAHGLILKNGYNELYDANILNIFGIMDINCPAPTIDATKNTWTPASSNWPTTDPNEPDWDEFDVSVQSNPGFPGNQILCTVSIDFTNVVGIAKCGEFDRIEPFEEGKSLVLSDDGFPQISTPTYFDSISYLSALAEIAATTVLSDTINGDDALASDMYYELLMTEMDSSLSDSLADVIRGLQFNAIGNYQGIIERMFADSIETSQANSSTFTPALQQYVDVLMHYTDSVKTAVNYHDQFKLELAKVALFNQIGKPENALQILANINYCDHDSIQKLILDQQIQTTSFAILAAENGADYYLIDSVVFALDSTLFGIPLAAQIDTSGFGSYISGPNSITYSVCENVVSKWSISSASTFTEHNLFPNPSSGSFRLELIGDEGSEKVKREIRIFDHQGRQVHEQTLSRRNTTIDVPHLSSGLYLYSIMEQSEPIMHGKVVISK